jgi:hypothetical protein
MPIFVQQISPWRGLIYLPIWAAQLIFIVPGLSIDRTTLSWPGFVHEQKKTSTRQAFQSR